MAVRNIMHTSNPFYAYAFSWTIDNFWRMPSMVQGPAFTIPIPGYSSKFYFELIFRDVYENNFSLFGEKCKFTIDGKTRNAYLDMKLRCLNDEVLNLRVVAYIVLHNPEADKTLFDETSFPRKVEQTTTLGTYSSTNLGNFCYPMEVLGLKISKLEMKGTLEFSGYDMASSIYSLPVQEPSKNCEELTNDLKTMYESGPGSDFTFVVGEEKLRAHKTILLGRSPVFAKMFEYDMLENNTNTVTIEDYDSHTFNCFLMFLYTDIVQDDKFETVVSLYSVAQKYQVKSLQNTCSMLLVKQLSVESVCRVLVLADLHNDVELKSNVKIFIRQNFFDIAGTAIWVELVTTNPILAHEVLGYMKSLHN